MCEFGESIDGAEKCEAFIRDIRAICKKHKVQVRVDGLDPLESLRAVQLEHDSGEGWLLDMEDIKRLVNEP
jgi:hypothetical protein